MMPFLARASIQKNRTCASENGNCRARKAYEHSAESENVVFIIDLRNCGHDRPCNTGAGARGTDHRTGIRARGTGRESLHRAIDRAHISTTRRAQAAAFRTTAARASKSESWQPRAKSFALWRIGGRRILNCGSREEKRGR